jgi:hypothetical protein
MLVVVQMESLGLFLSPHTFSPSPLDAVSWSPAISKFRHTPARKSQNQGYLFTLHLHSILLRAGADAETNTPNPFASLCGRARRGQLANSRLRNYTMPRTHTRKRTLLGFGLCQMNANIQPTGFCTENLIH